MTEQINLTQISYEVDPHLDLPPTEQLSQRHSVRLLRIGSGGGT